MKSPRDTEFGIQYERILKATGVTSDADLARVLGITQPSVCDTKVRKSIPKAWLIKVHDMFGTSIDWLMFGDATMPTHATALIADKSPRVHATNCRPPALMSQEFQTVITDLFNTVAIEDGVEKLTINANPTLIEVTAIKSDGTIIKHTFASTSNESTTMYKQNTKADREKEAKRLYTTVGLTQKEIAQRLNRSQAWVSGVVKNK